MVNLQNTETVTDLTLLNSMSLNEWMNLNSEKDPGSPVCEPPFCDTGGNIDSPTLPENEVYFFHPDHLGSTSYITNIVGETVQFNSYLPFGESFVSQKRTSTISNYLFNGKEKDLETQNSYYGARYYNSELSIWLSVDPMWEKYVSRSPYEYVHSNPINAIDPDGRVVIFINGQHGGSGGSREYWGKTANIIAAKFKDYNARFYDGGTKGWTNTVSLLAVAPITLGGSLFGLNLFASNRAREGKQMGYRDAAKIYGALADGETIKIATHSMGAAYAKGFIRGLRKYAKEQGRKDDRIERVLDIAPFQPRMQDKVEGNVLHEQLSDSRDWLGTGYKENGITNYFDEAQGREGYGFGLDYYKNVEIYHDLSNFNNTIKTREDAVETGSASTSANNSGKLVELK